MSYCISLTITCALIYCSSACCRGPTRYIGNRQHVFQCGHVNQHSSVKQTTNTYRIVGGKISEAHRWPWQVSLKNSSKIHFCGGSLVRVSSTLQMTDIVLTAAHCVNPFNVSNIFVVAGEYDQTVHEGTEQESAVDLKLIHPQFIPSYDVLENDIAIVRLIKPIQFGEGARPVCVANATAPAGTHVYATGWGWTSTTGMVSNQLREVVIPIVNHTDCFTQYLSLGWKIVEAQMICAGVPGKDSCKGDSGGPLVLKNAVDNRYYLQGIVSFGQGCAEQGYPGVFTRVASYCGWLKLHISEHSRLVDSTLDNLC